MPWKIIDNEPDLKFFPSPPEGDYYTIEGEFRLNPNTPQHMRYEHSEEQIGPGTVRVVIQREINPTTNGVACWFPERDTWFLQSSHFKNTLLNDSDFDALVSKNRILNFPGMVQVNKEQQ